MLWAEETKETSGELQARQVLQTLDIDALGQPSGLQTVWR